MRKTTIPAVVTTFVVCFAFWLLLTWSFAAQELIAGAVISLAVALFSARFFIHEKAFWFCNPVKFFNGLFYWLCIFPIELVKANVDMAKRCFGGCKKINPGIVKVPVDLKSDYGQAALANSITRSPRKRDRPTITSIGSTSPPPAGKRRATPSRAPWKKA